MVKIAVGVMGGHPFAMTDGMSKTEQIGDFLKVCKQFGVKELDTARLYGQGSSERMLGENDASSFFSVSTKILTARPTDGTLTAENVTQSVQDSLEALKVKQVDILYIHQPDSQTPIQETLAAIDQLYRQGVFKRFGICHYNADQVKEIYDICKQNEYVLPRVYQGGYNALSRDVEKDLLPMLRQLDIVFYGFGATAGGTLAKPIEQIMTPAKDSRWATLPIIKMMYGKESVMDQVKRIHAQCKLAHIPIGEASLRWLKHHSAMSENDVILLGASSVVQLEQNLSALQKGPLPDSLADTFHAAWPAIM